MFELLRDDPPSFSPAPLPAPAPPRKPTHRGTPGAIIHLSARKFKVESWKHKGKNCFYKVDLDTNYCSCYFCDEGCKHQIQAQEYEAAMKSSAKSPRSFPQPVSDPEDEFDAMFAHLPDRTGPPPRFIACDVVSVNGVATLVEKTANGVTC